jgi:hypothetical protein
LLEALPEPVIQPPARNPASISAQSADRPRGIVPNGGLQYFGVRETFRNPEGFQRAASKSAEKLATDAVPRIGRGFVEIGLDSAKAERNSKRQPGKSSTGDCDASAH